MVKIGCWQNALQKRMVKHTSETYGEAIHFIREPYGQKRVVWAKMYGLKRMAQKYWRHSIHEPYGQKPYGLDKANAYSRKKMHQMKSI